jgi:hypothetical protein
MEDKGDAEYPNYIVPIDSSGTASAFVGDYNRYGDKDLSIDYNKLTSGNGCNISTKIYFPIEQKFYNEIIEAGKTKLKGFNFYYRPIDIDNPFPNGIGTNSLWAEWERNNQPDLSKSYEEVTYIAANIDADEIRRYTKNHPYTSWLSMDINGKSNFIETRSIVTRKTTYNGYGLGCGPANEDEYLDGGNKNPLYIEGCDT